MNKDSHGTVGRSIISLLYNIWSGMPVLTSVWIFIPLLLGFLIVPSYAAQRDLVNLFVGGTAGTDWEIMIERALPALILFTGTALLRAGLAALQNIINSRLDDRASMHIQSEVHERSVNIPLEQMEQSEYYDRLQRAEKAAGTDLFGLLQNTIVFIGLIFELIALLIVASSSHIVVGILLVVVLVVSFIIRLESDIVVRRLNRNLTKSGRQSDYLRTTITEPETIRDMRISGSIEYLISKWSEVMRNSLTLRMNARRREIRRGIFVSTLQITGLFGAIAFMVIQMKSGGFTPGTLVIVFLAMRRAFGLSFRLVFPIGKIYIQSASIYDLVEFLRMPSEINKTETVGANKRSDKESLPSPFIEPGNTGRIEFEDVTFRYNNSDEPVLHGIRMTLNPGETVALVGENGAGKTTLTQILLGLYQPSSGRITWDGKDYKSLHPVLHKQLMSAVFQDFVRYETTLRDNVSFGMSDEMHSDEDLRRTLQLGGASGLENITEGLDTRVGMMMEGGRDLSGGQWQRLAIARAAMRNARLLVLDEPTAALDPQQESELYSAFRELAKGRTVLFISHRLGWARFADRIVVLRDGQIIEEGSHETLVASGKEYAAMFHAQAGWYRDGELKVETNRPS